MFSQCKRRLADEALINSNSKARRSLKEAALEGEISTRTISRFSLKEVEPHWPSFEFKATVQALPALGIMYKAYLPAFTVCPPKLTSVLKESQVAALAPLRQISS